MSDAKSPLSAGVTVAGTYDVERLLGKGGMGEVWLARHLRLAGKQVAIKVLHTLAQPPSTELLARFRREAEIAARLEHPNIVQVLDFNQLPSGEPYLVMELLKGQSLADRLRAGGALSPGFVQAIVLQVGSALQAAHAAGVVHRDLKPDNIFLVPTALGDQVKVLDFGISKLAEASTVQTTEQTLLGTPLYMSPEQALGQNRDTTAQSDIFSLGSICYELLTGVAPFVAESIAQVVFRIAYQPHQPLVELAPQLPPNIVHAVEHALVKDRAQRTPDIATFIRELTGEELATPARPVALGDESEAVSGVYKPGMRVSDSLMNNATVAPSVSKMTPSVSRRPSQATPRPTTPAPAPEVAERPSGLSPGVLAGLLVAGLAVIGVAGYAWQASRQQVVATPPKPVPPAVVAGGLAKPTVTPTPVPTVGEPDAGPSAPAPETDAGAELATAPLDAGAAKTPARPPPMAVVSLTADEARIVNELKALKSSGDWESLSRHRLTALNGMTSNGGRREVLLLTLEAECALNQLQSINSDYRRLEKLKDAAALGRAKEVCRRHVPDWEAP